MQSIQNLVQNYSKKTGTDFTDKQLGQKEYSEHEAERDNNAIGHLNETDGYNCDLCKNRGYTTEVIYADVCGGYWTTHNVTCKCMKTRETIKRLKRSGLESIVKEFAFDNYETKEPWQANTKELAIKYCNANPVTGWFYLGGQSGSGKTHICSAMAVQFIRRGYKVRYMKWRNEITRIKSVANDSEQYDPIMDELGSVDVLYIDDLFKTGKGADGRTVQPTIADINAAYTILDKRYVNKLPTIISCESTVSELNDIDEAVAGRIVQMAKLSGCLIVYKKEAAKNYRMSGITEM